jgi:Tfp pilus assembly protein PilE
MRLIVPAKDQTSQESGFTIIEFMIATIVFSSILIIAVIAVNGFFLEYYRGVVSSSTQNTARSLSSQIEHSIEYSASTVGSIAPSGSTPGYFCTDSEEYVFYLGQTETTSYPYPPLEAMPLGAAQVCVPNPADNASPAVWAERQSLLGTHYRLTAFSVSGPVTFANSIDDEWAIDIKIAYTTGGVDGTGDSLLCAPSVSGSCATGATMPSSDFTAPDVTCKNQIGSEYCSVAGLQSIIGNHL